MLPIGLVTQSISRTFNLLLIQFPSLATKYIPRCESLISLTHLYVFFQALGILWLLFVTIMAVGATRVANVWIDLTPWEIFKFLPLYALKGYIYFSMLRVGLGVGKSLWRNGWEVYGDYPTLRAMLNPKVAVLVKSTRTAQILTLMCPLVVFGILAAILGVIQVSLYVFPVDESGDSVRDALGNPASRLNRILRFTLWIGLLQWAQMFQYIFPAWPRAVPTLSRSKQLLLLSAFLVLVPVSLIRCLQWVVVITPPRSHQIASILYMLGGVSWDCWLMVSWALVMFSVAREILGNKYLLEKVAWRKSAFVEESVWCQAATLLKFGYLFACMLIFVRAFLSPNKGFSYGQNDLVVLTVSYPLLMVITTWFTKAVLALRHRRLAGVFVILFIPVSALLCSLASIHASGAVAGFWLHMVKYFVRTKKIQPPDSPERTFSNPPKTDTPSTPVVSTIRRSFSTVSTSILNRIIKPVGPRTSNGMERLIAKNFFSNVAIPFTYLYGLLVLVLSVLSLIQQHMHVSAPGEYLSVVRPDDHTIAVRHAVSEMQLFTSVDARLKKRMDPPDLPIYAVCGKDFWGFSIVDYGLFSMVSYVGDDAVTQRAVDDLFPSEWNVTVVRNEEYTGDKFWTEFLINGTSTVIAVRGSEFWRMADYVEDLRMWTEPVAKSLLTLVFPTVRAWSPKTTAMVFDFYQAFLAFIGIPDDGQYKYQQLLDYIQKRGLLRDRSNLVITGHSLGGGIAQIVGAIAKVPAVTFLSPGMYQTASKFFYHSSKGTRQIVEMVHNQSVSIQVENDFVGKYLDSHAGLVQTITCSVDHLAPLTCHLIDNCICNLVRHCKDPRFPGGCDFKYDFDIFLNATFPEESFHELRKNFLEPITSTLNSYFSTATDTPSNSSLDVGDEL
jgi:hypothetical protein